MIVYLYHIIKVQKPEKLLKCINAETTLGSPVCFDLVAYALISRESLSDAQKNDPMLEKSCVNAENNVSPSLQ